MTKSTTHTFMPPIHPGTILLTEFLEPYGLKPYTLSKLLNMPRSNVENVVRGKRSLSAEMALRLSQLFGNSPEFWVNAQAFYDLECARERLGNELDSIDKYEAA